MLSSVESAIATVNGRVVQRVIGINEELEIAETVHRLVGAAIDKKKEAARQAG